ncbi:hypothetical protein FRX31_015136 [Thalictrum thalictroides]|uniref:Uncharacterized protein n=1 Tax=Thalictrum thalictroides TaxID=46969 RepID=A0A7J6WCW6_THATH|nr:hypothetical protein FRX31_015136 [Thalictrum thalictroides]
MLINNSLALKSRVAKDDDSLLHYLLMDGQSRGFSIEHNETCDQLSSQSEDQVSEDDTQTRADIRKEVDLGISGDYMVDIPKPKVGMKFQTDSFEIARVVLMRFPPLQRWTKDARVGVVVDNCGQLMHINGSSSLALRHSELVHTALTLAAKAASSEKSSAYSKEKLAQLLDEIDDLLKTS